MNKESASRVPKQLTGDQTTSRVTLVKEHFRRFKHDVNNFELYCHFG